MAVSPTETTVKHTASYIQVVWRAQTHRRRKLGDRALSHRHLDTPPPSDTPLDPWIVAVTQG
jgi:hypothetical protein